jgi:hypothetical protein
MDSNPTNRRMMPRPHEVVRLEGLDEDQALRAAVMEFVQEIGQATIAVVTRPR